MPVPITAADEVGSLARELARSYAGLVESLARVWGITPAEATAKAHSTAERAAALAQSEPPEEIAWWELAQAIEHDPALGLTAWQRIRDAARQELASGHRTALALDRSSRPWDRAQFLALRQAFREAWRPRGGIEAALVDVLAESFSAYLRWTERINLYAESECQTENRTLKSEGHWQPPRLAEEKWLAYCSGQVEAAHKRYLMTLKSLQELRRLPAVSINSVGQLNMATQQVVTPANTSSADDIRLGP